jgi:hypothetical protein
MSIQKAELPNKCKVADKCQNCHWFQTPNLKIWCSKQVVGNSIKGFKSTAPDQHPHFSVRWHCISLEQYNEITWCKSGEHLLWWVCLLFCFNWRGYATPDEPWRLSQITNKMASSVFIVPTGTLQLPWLRFLCAYSWVVRQMPGLTHKDGARPALFPIRL